MCLGQFSSEYYAKLQLRLVYRRRFLCFVRTKDETTVTSWSIPFSCWQQHCNESGSYSCNLYSRNGATVFPMQEYNGGGGGSSVGGEYSFRRQSSERQHDLRIDRRRIIIIVPHFDEIYKPAQELVVNYASGSVSCVNLTPSNRIVCILLRIQNMHMYKCTFVCTYQRIQCVCGYVQLCPHKVCMTWDWVGLLECAQDWEAV